MLDTACVHAWHIYTHVCMSRMHAMRITSRSEHACTLCFACMHVRSMLLTCACAGVPNRNSGTSRNPNRNPGTIRNPSRNPSRNPATIRTPNRNPNRNSRHCNPANPGPASHNSPSNRDHPPINRTGATSRTDATVNPTGQSRPCHNEPCSKSN